jgi:Zn finger protein HypA/HybF involved in hydrogenase expression
MMGQPNGSIKRNALTCEDCDVEFSGVAARYCPECRKAHIAVKNLRPPDRMMTDDIKAASEVLGRKW